jgi:FkbM family methyltransferase
LSFSITLGNFLFRNAYFIYRPLYSVFKGKQDAFEISLIRQFVEPGDVILDIGANIGFYARKLSTLTGKNGIVHCFEPDEMNFSRLRSACRKVQNIVLNDKAVGPRTEKIKIYTSPTLNVDHRTYKPDHYENEIEIDAVSIDDYLEKRANGLKVNFIKMDIQGFENQALLGMRRTLEINPNIVMLSEFWPYGLKKAGTSPTIYYENLTSAGLTVSLIDDNKLTELNWEKAKAMEDLGEEHYFNILAKKRDV